MSVIVLIDDNDDLREIFSLFLSMEGHTVHSAPGGREGIELLKTVHRDLILLDIMMPGMDGWETLCAIKQDPATRALAVSMCSGKLPDLKEVNLYGKDIEDYLLKPQELPELSGTLVSIMERSTKNRAEIESLKNNNPDHHLVDEFYNSQKILYILEKFFRFFTLDLQEIEADIHRYKARIQEIHDSCGYPSIPGLSEPQPGT